MDLEVVREALAEAFVRSGLTQQVVAERAGLRQGHLSKVLDTSAAMPDLTARVLLAVIEKGLSLPLSAFFHRLESRTTLSEESRQTSTDVQGAQRNVTVGLAPPQVATHVADRAVSLAEELAAIFTTAAHRSNRQRTKVDLLDLAYAIQRTLEPEPIGQRSTEAPRQEPSRSGRRRRAG